MACISLHLFTAAVPPYGAMFGPGAEWTARIRSPHGTGKGGFGKLPRSAVLMRKKIQEVSCLISSRKGSSYLKDCFCSCKFESPTTNKANKFAHRFFSCPMISCCFLSIASPPLGTTSPQKKTPPAHTTFRTPRDLPGV